MFKATYLKSFLLVSILILLTACDSKLTQKEIAIDKIATYADNKTPPTPTMLDYSNAGVYGVTDKNLNEINFEITQLAYSDVDTTIEIQHVVNSIVPLENHQEYNKQEDKVKVGKVSKKTQKKVKKVKKPKEIKTNNNPVHIKETPKSIEATHDGYRDEDIKHHRLWIFEEDRVIIEDTLNRKSNAVASLHFHPNVTEKEILKYIIIENEHWSFSEYEYASQFNKLEKAICIYINFTMKLKVTIKV